MPTGRYLHFATKLWLLVSATCLSCSSQSQAFSVSSLTIDNGLKTNTVTAIVQDKEGFIWIGSLDGLSRFDGYELRHFRHEPDVPDSLSNNLVTDLVVDAMGTLWVSTFNGLNKYNDSTLSFERYSFTQASYSGGVKQRKSYMAVDEKSLWFAHQTSLYRYSYETDALEAINYFTGDISLFSEDYITALMIDDKSRIWVAFKISGLMTFDLDTKTLNRVQLKYPKKDRYQNLPYESPRINSLLQAPDRQIWIGTQGHGLFSITPSGKQTHYPYSKSYSGALPSRSVNTLFSDNQGILWVGTVSGLSEKNKKNNNFYTYKFHPAKRRGLTNDNILDIYQDRSGLIWIGTQTGGVNIYNPATEFFHHKHVNDLEPTTLSDEVIRGMAEDYKGDIWIGTQHGGVNRLNLKTSQIKHYRANKNNPYTIPHDRVSAVYEDRDHDLWVTTLDGIALYNRQKDRFEPVFNDPNEPDKLTVESPISIIQDKEGLIWIGTRSKGLFRYNKKTQAYKEYTHNRADPHSLSYNGVRPLLEDSKGHIWVGTKNGLNRLDKSTDLFTQYHHSTSDKASISGEYIYSIYEDAKGRVWVGTADGLSLYHVKTDNFSRFTKDDGLPNNHIYGILEDAETNHLWLSTNYGLSQLNMDTMTFRNYDVSHGLQGYEFNPPSALKTRSGMMFFGGISGFNFFHPRAIKKNPFTPRVVITNIGAIDPDRLPKDVPVYDIESIALKHTDQVISLQFAALDYTNSSRNEYRYMLEGFKPTWVEGVTKNEVTYTNLDPGKYTFKVMGSNSDGVWSENVAKLNIIVHPAPWATLFAKFVYAAAFLCLVIFYIYRHRKELAKERDVAAKLREVSALKDQFLATTSHELRTPMNGVIGTASLLSETSLSNEQREYIDLIRISSENLLSIINDILDFSRIEARKIELEQRDFSVSQLVEEVLDIFAVQAQKNGIELAYFIESEINDTIKTDPTRLRQILINLVGNALKFTHQGEVIVNLSRRHSKGGYLLHFCISDTGIGIPRDKMNNLFEAFTQVDASTTRRFGGTGLGLAISRRLVELMGGEISVESSVLEGTRFSFTVPGCQNNHSNNQPASYVNHLFKKQHVLLCHENDSISNVTKKMMLQWGLEVTQFNTLKQNPDDLDNLKPNLLLINHNKKVSHLDQNMSLIKMFDRIPIIFMSSLTREELQNIYELQTFEVKSPVKWQRLYAMCSALLQISDFKPQKNTTPVKKRKLELASDYPARILIAEDNIINQRIAQQMLLRLGYRNIKIVNNGLEAVEEAKKTHYDVILMDVQMPELDGLNATRQIVQSRSKKSLQKIIAMTANAMEGDRETCLMAGMNSYLPKPVKMLELRNQLETILSMARDEAAMMKQDTVDPVSEQP